MASHLHPSNCIGVRNFAQLHGHCELMSRADQFILHNFTAVAASDEFRDMTINNLHAIIASSYLNVRSEVRQLNSIGISHVYHLHYLRVFSLFSRYYVCFINSDNSLSCNLYSLVYLLVNSAVMVEEAFASSYIFVSSKTFWKYFLEIQKLGLQVPHFGGFRDKIELLSTHNLLCL